MVYTNIGFLSVKRVGEVSEVVEAVEAKVHFVVVGSGKSVVDDLFVVEGALAHWLGGKTIAD